VSFALEGFDLDRFVAAALAEADEIALLAREQCEA
jgi:hypothetical protein